MNQRKYGAILSYINIFVKNGVNFIYVPFLLKYVGQAEYGLFQMTNSTIISLTLLSLGFSSAYVKFYMNYKYSDDSETKIKKLNGFYLILFLSISILSIIIGLFLVKNTQLIFGKSLNNHEIDLTRMLMSILVLNVSLSFPSSVFDSYILANEKFIFQQIRQLMQSILVPLIAVPFIVYGFGVTTIVIVQTAITILFLMMNVHYCLFKLNMKFDFHNIPKEYIKEIGIFSLFIFLNQVVDMINNNVPNFILGIMSGSREVATFSIAVQIKNVFFMLSMALSSVYIPTVNKLVSKDTDKKELTNLMVSIGRIQMSILFFILGGFIVVGRYFINVWAGPENYLSYELVILMVLPSLAPLCQNIGIEIQRAYNKHIFRSVVYIIFALINILITIIGTKYLGLIGASLGYVVSLLFANGLLMNWYYHNRMGLNMKFYWMQTLKCVIPFFIAVLSMKIYIHFIQVDSLIKFMITSFFYVMIYCFVYFVFIANKDEIGLFTIK